MFHKEIKTFYLNITEKKIVFFFHNFRKYFKIFKILEKIKMLN